MMTLCQQVFDLTMDRVRSPEQTNRVFNCLCSFFSILFTKNSANTNECIRKSFGYESRIVTWIIFFRNWRKLKQSLDAWKKIFGFSYFFSTIFHFFREKSGIWNFSFFWLKFVFVAKILILISILDTKFRVRL